ncbi:hypothetical protein [Gramella sp. MAR_2010_147]|uniref:hypothetical protein n=1 Tax=Gramella sp. MAR_2010_147 TaxID=1250205 RepID=UPI00087A1354|nr:hypothetical protein [Gramella sp. MAR_2010_147]SDR76643.1 hypothetical protein SAMN04488553_0606 [Gramella sp. MAR_2010_147]
MFEGKNSKKIDYLEEERQKLWERLILLEKKIDEKPSDIEKEAKQASKKAAEYRNRTEERLNQAEIYIEKFSTIENEIESKHREINLKHTVVLDRTNEILTNGENLESTLTTITDILEKHPNLKSEVQQLDTLIETVEENSSKANTTYKGILSKKTEIDEVYREIIGYEDEDEEGNIVEIEGLKNKLDSTYNELKTKSEKLEEGLEKLTISSEEDYKKYIETHQDELDELKDSSQSEYNQINKKIESLLPNALTAGLSSAFVAKKAEEEKLHTEYKASFRNGIIFLTIAAVIPISISVFFLATGSTLTEVIERSPKVILSFLPLYIPLVWITISANKKVNLSKRLIEEYSHKQVLSMTIEGLSKQIENIENSVLSEELRINLIRNFLEVTNENPGKLISNYQKSDNPILNILDRDGKAKEEKSIVETIEDSTKEIIATASNEIEEKISKEVI